MAKIAGRKVTLWDVSGTPALVAGGRENGITVNGEHIDVTDKSSDGWRTYMAEIGLRSVDVSFSGLFDSAALLEASLGDSTALLTAYEIRIDGLGVISGTFAMNGLEISTPHDNATEISTTFASSGAVVWTAD